MGEDGPEPFIVYYLSPSRSIFLRDVIHSFRDQEQPQLGASTTWMLQINGDVQRGKSTVEAFIALVTWLISNSTLCLDNACTVLGTQMSAWARNLSQSMGRRRDFVERGWGVAAIVTSRAVTDNFSSETNLGSQT